MTKAFALAAGLLAATALPTLAHDEEALRQSPPPAPFIQVSDALPLPEFIPGLGTLFVDPATLWPAGFPAPRHGRPSRHRRGRVRDRIASGNPQQLQTSSPPFSTPPRDIGRRIRCSFRDRTLLRRFRMRQGASAS